MSNDTQTLTLNLSLGADALPEEVNHATTQLIRELQNLDADSVEKVVVRTAKGSDGNLKAMVERIE